MHAYHTGPDSEARHCYFIQKLCPLLQNLNRNTLLPSAHQSLLQFTLSVPRCVHPLSPLCCLHVTSQVIVGTNAISLVRWHTRWESRPLLEKSIGPRGPGGRACSSFMLWASPKGQLLLSPRMFIIMAAFYNGRKEGGLFSPWAVTLTS